MITPLPAAPVVSDSTPVFNAKAFAMVGALPGLVSDINAVIPTVNQSLTASAAALAAANFKGDWSTLSGALSIPASVSYGGNVWLLIANTSNVASDTPGVSSKWIPLFGKLPVGTTAQRPASPAFGDVYANSTTGDLEWYDPSTIGWKKFSQPSGYSVNYLVVAGGAGGGSGAYSGGGGAGGVAAGSANLTAGTAYTITVGSGGAASASGTSSSIASAITALGGGRGGAESAAGTPGGSGGGAGNGSFAGGSGTSGQGYAGGSTPPSGPNSGGGGGSSAAGVSPANGAVVGGAGGAGTSNSISGSAVTYATGGSGVTTGAATNGASNTGNGGTGNSGTGGSGIVIISYLGSQRGTGGTVTSVGGYTIHTFTSSGTFNA